MDKLFNRLMRFMGSVTYSQTKQTTVQLFKPLNVLWHGSRRE